MRSSSDAPSSCEPVKKNHVKSDEISKHDTTAECLFRWRNFGTHRARLQEGQQLRRWLQATSGKVKRGTTVSTSSLCRIQREGRAHLWGTQDKQAGAEEAEEERDLHVLTRSALLVLQKGERKTRKNFWRLRSRIRGRRPAKVSEPAKTCFKARVFSRV